MPFWNELFLEWLWFNRRRDCWHRSISLSLAAAGIQRNLLCCNLKELQQVTASFRRSVSLRLRPPLRCDLLESLFGRRGGLQFGEPVLFLFARGRGAAVERRGALYDVVRQVGRRRQHFYATTCTNFIKSSVSCTEDEDWRGWSDLQQPRLWHRILKIGRCWRIERLYGVRITQN